MVYAQIDAAGVCIGVSQLLGEVEAADLVPLSEYDTTVLGKRWTGSAWEAVPLPEPEPYTDPDETARLAIMEALADNYEQNLQQKEQNLALMDALADLYEAMTPTGGN